MEKIGLLLLSYSIYIHYTKLDIRRLFSITHKSFMILALSQIFNDTTFGHRLQPIAYASALTTTFGHFFILKKYKPSDIEDFITHHLNSMIVLISIYKSPLSIKTKKNALLDSLIFVSFHISGEYLYKGITKKWIYGDNSNLQTKKGRNNALSLLAINYVFYNNLSNQYLISQKYNLFNKLLKSENKINIGRYLELSSLYPMFYHIFKRFT